MCVLGVDAVFHDPAAALAGQRWLTGTLRYANAYPAAISLAASGAVDLTGPHGAVYRRGVPAIHSRQ